MSLTFGIGNDVVYRNAAGEFLVREKHAGLLGFQVVLGELSFVVVSAPAIVLPAPENSAPDIVIVLRANVQTRKRSKSRSAVDGNRECIAGAGGFHFGQDGSRGKRKALTQRQSAFQYHDLPRSLEFRLL